MTVTHDHSTVDYQEHTVVNSELRYRLEKLGAIVGRTVRVMGDAGFPDSSIDNRESHLSYDLIPNSVDMAIEGLTARETSEVAARSNLFDGVGHYCGSTERGAFTRVVLDADKTKGSGQRWIVNSTGILTDWHDQNNIYQPFAFLGDS